jgi:hypothetical protein
VHAIPALFFLLLKNTNIGARASVGRETIHHHQGIVIDDKKPISITIHCPKKSNQMHPTNPENKLKSIMIVEKIDKIDFKDPSIALTKVLIFTALCD